MAGCAAGVVATDAWSEEGGLCRSNGSFGAQEVAFSEGMQEIPRKMSGEIEKEDSTMLDDEELLWATKTSGDADVDEVGSAQDKTEE